MHLTESGGFSPVVDLDICARDKCSGCWSCYAVCPQHCIEMRADSEGFLYPKVDADRCVKCGKCKSVCTGLRKGMPRSADFGLAFCSHDEELLRNTSSGGFFTWAARRVLRQGGVVLGAALNEKNEVEHVVATDEEELSAIRRSKYVQSKIGESYLLCRRFLEDGRLVLFSGTPCQVRGLLAVLGRPYEHLVTVDFVCHGVPSPGVFDRYLSELANKERCGKSDLKELNFRNKKLSCACSFSYTVNDVCHVQGLHRNHFLKGFIADLFLRRSCHDCMVKSFSSGADYTMCDFWRIHELMPEMSSSARMGANQVFVFNDKLGLRQFQSDDKWAAQKFDVSDRRYYQRWVYDSAPARLRARFFAQYLEGKESVSEIVELLTKQSAIAKILSCGRRCIKFVLRQG